MKPNNWATIDYSSLIYLVLEAILWGGFFMPWGVPKKPVLEGGGSYNQGSEDSYSEKYLQNKFEI